MPGTLDALGWSGAFLASSLASSLAMKQATNALPNYAFSISIIHITVLTAAFFLFAAFGKVTPAARAMPLRTFVLLGAMDALSGVLVLLGGTFVSGPTQQLLSQASIPLTMISGFLFFKRQPHPDQVVGAAVILVGVVLALAPKFSSAGSASSSSSSSSVSLVYHILFALSVIPTVAATLYKEAAMTEQDVDGNYLNAWTGLCQIVFTLACLPLNSLPMLGDSAVNLSDLGETVCLPSTTTVCPQLTKR